MLLQKVTRATELNMRFPPKSIGQNERLLNADEISAVPCTGKARKFVEHVVNGVELGDKVEISGEIGSQSDEFGYVYRYRVTGALDENGKNYDHDVIYVLWSKDCKSMGIVSFPTLELNLPRSPKGL
jgi:hypothetical protein